MGKEISSAQAAVALFVKEQLSKLRHYLERTEISEFRLSVPWEWCLSQAGDDTLWWGLCHISCGVYPRGQRAAQQFPVLQQGRSCSSLALPGITCTDRLYRPQNTQHFNSYSPCSKAPANHARQLLSGEAVQVVIYFQHYCWQIVSRHY